MKLHKHAVTYFRPWDPHTHLRSPAQIGQTAFEKLLRLNTIHYAVAIVEPNAWLDQNKPHHHIYTEEDVLHYRDIVEKARSSDNRCRLYYLIKLTDTTQPEALDKALALSFVVGVKIYPEGVTTGANHGGVSDFWGPRIRENFAVIAERKKIVQVHPERPGVTSSKREFEYRGILECHVAQNPNITFFAEHISDRHTLPLVEQYTNLYGTVTGHHLRLTEDDVLGSSDRFCRPHAKDPQDRDELVRAVVGLRPRCKGKIISITDSAYHGHSKKHEARVDNPKTFEACAGILNPGEIAIPDVVSVFDEYSTEVRAKNGVTQEKAFEELEPFTSLNAAHAYKLPHDPKDTITVFATEWFVPKCYDMDGDPATVGVPFKATQRMKLGLMDTDGR